MGCCSSNIQKPLHSDLPELPVEEREIQVAESKLAFSHRNLKELLGLIQIIDFPLDIGHFASLCDLYNIKQHSPSGRFFYNLIQKKALDRYQLRSLFLLLCEGSSDSKADQILCEDKKSCLFTMQELLNTSIEVIPNNLENIDTGIFNYTKQLKTTSEIYMEEMSKLPLDDIKRKITEIEITSKELRIKMLSNMRTLNHKKHSEEKNFAPKNDESIGVNNINEKSNEDSNDVTEVIESYKKEDKEFEVMPEMEEEIFVVSKGKAQEEEERPEEFFEEIVITENLDIKKSLNQEFEDYSVEVSETDLLNDSLPSMNSKNDEGNLGLDKGNGNENNKLFDILKKPEIIVQKPVQSKVVSKISEENLVEFDISDDSWLLSMDDDSLISPFRPSDCVEKVTDNPESVSKLFAEIDKKSMEITNDGFQPDPKILKYHTTEAISKDSPKAPTTHSKFKFPWPEAKSPKSNL